jgi:hypothetical protein
MRPVPDRRWPVSLLSGLVQVQPWLAMASPVPLTWQQAQASGLQPEQTLAQPMKKREPKPMAKVEWMSWTE